MIELVFLLACLACSAGTAAVLTRRENAALRRERAAADADARESRERLLAAKNAGADIPPAPSDWADRPIDPPLIPELTDAVLDWDTPAAQEAQLKYIRAQMARGRSQSEIARDLTVTQ